MLVFEKRGVRSERGSDLDVETMLSEKSGPNYLEKWGVLGKFESCTNQKVEKTAILAPCRRRDHQGNLR